MNPPGKALKRGVTDIAVKSNHPTPDQPKLAGNPDAPTEQGSTAPVFRILGLVLIVVGAMAMFAGLLGAGGEGNSLSAFISGLACLFWAALMYAIAEVLTRLAEISAAVRKRAGE